MFVCSREVSPTVAQFQAPQERGLLHFPDVSSLHSDRHAVLGVFLD